MIMSSDRINQHNLPEVIWASNITYRTETLEYMEQRSGNPITNQIGRIESTPDCSKQKLVIHIETPVPSNTEDCWIHHADEDIYNPTKLKKAYTNLETDIYWSLSSSYFLCMGT